MTVKKATLPSSNLPPVNAENKYTYRYRIVSEDKNRTSSWSPIKTISAPTVIPLTIDQGAVTVSGNSIIATWSDENNRPRYDVFVKFDNEDYFYHGTTPIHTYSFVKKTGATTVSVAIQVEGILVDGTKPFYGTTGNLLLVYLDVDNAL